MTYKDLHHPPPSFPLPASLIPFSTALPSLTFPCPATLASLLFFDHAKHSRASGTLHLLFLLLQNTLSHPISTLPDIQWLVSHFKALLNRNLNRGDFPDHLPHPLTSSSCFVILQSIYHHLTLHICTCFFISLPH